MFYTCGHDHHKPKRMVADDQGGGGRGRKQRVVDIHCHRQSATVGARMKAEAERQGHAALSFGVDLPQITKDTNAKQLEFIKPKMANIDVRLADMDAMGVDVQAISVPPFQYYYWADAEVGRAAARDMNDEMAEICAAHPDRFVALATIPMQNPEMAVAEMERAVNELGMRGVEISTNDNGMELSDPSLEAVFAKAQEMDIVVFIHPEGFTQPNRMTQHYLINLVGHPLESTLAISALIFDGVMERMPGLKICVAHGGGFLGAYPARMDHAYHAREDVRHGLPKPPGEYLKQFYFDSMVFAPDQLGFLVEKYGADHILLGTDYPLDMGESDPLGLIGGVTGLDDAARAAIAGGNAAKLLKL
ncbi:MAG: amidohydrolase family protein [Rhodospirillaceae bacterium]